MSTGDGIKRSATTIFDDDGLFDDKQGPDGAFIELKVYLIYLLTNVLYAGAMTLAKYKKKEIREVNVNGFKILPILYAINSVITVIFARSSGRIYVQYPLFVSVFATQMALLVLLVASGPYKNLPFLAPNLLLTTLYIFIFMIFLTFMLQVCLKRSIRRTEHCQLQIPLLIVFIVLFYSTAELLKMFLLPYVYSLLLISTMIYGIQLAPEKESIYIWL